MILKPCSLRIDMRQHETDQRGTPMFPCAGYLATVGDDITKWIPWHWHAEVELTYVACGVLKLDVPNQTMHLKEGDAVLINSSVLHTFINADNTPCKIHSFVFDPQIIFGSLESAIEQKYVRPLLTCQAFRVIHFDQNINWHKDVITCICDAFSHYQTESFGYELLVRENLSKLWFSIAIHYQEELKLHHNTKNTDALRVEQMLGYIHTHFTDAIFLRDIANVAVISERECLRCFHKVLGTTPMQYLLNHRISAAAGMLMNSDANITEICKSSGFASPSYFSSMFKKRMDLSPKEYRNCNRPKAIQKA